MLVEQVREWLAQGEGLMIEFKSVTSGRLGSSVFETVVAFSNRYGGHILLGVADDGTVLGLNHAQIEGLKRNFANVLSNPELVFPSLYLEPETVDVDGKLILAVYVPPHSSPVQYKSHAYDRAEDGDVDISRNVGLLNALFERKSGRFTERKLFPLITEADLRLAELMPVVRQRAVNKTEGHPWGQMTDLEILRSAGLIDTDPASAKECFNLAAVLLFGTDKTIVNCCPGYVIDCVLRVDDTWRYDDRLMVTCNLIDAFDQVMSFIAKHTLDRFFVVDDERTSVRSHIAFEVVSNLLSHQEFASTMPARVTIDRDSLVTENWNRPLRSGPIDPDNYKPDPKNPLIAKFFVNIGFADTLGSGVRNLYKYTRIYSGQDPQLIDGDVFETIIPLARPSQPDTADNVRKDVRKDVRKEEDLTDSERLILQLLRDDPTLTASQLAKAANITERQTFRLLEQLRTLGLIQREGGRRYGKWITTAD
ncbi:MAG: putative DNA binding domain-containing protein [Micrococcales bacterium]|nr:putative DNA binding domain-containing protein [Micrococcales bacterium]